MPTRDVHGRDRMPGRTGGWTLVVLLLPGIWLSVAPHVLEYGAVGVPLRATVNGSPVGVAVVWLAMLGLGRPQCPVPPG